MFIMFVTHIFLVFLSFADVEFAAEKHYVRSNSVHHSLWSPY